MTTLDAGTREAIERFNEAFNSHDVDAIMAHMTDDVVFESTGPGPVGERYEGALAVRALWTSFFEQNPRAWFETEEMVVAGNRCTVRWTYTFDGDDPDKGWIRGIDLFTVRDGKVAEKLSYVKG